MVDDSSHSQGPRIPAQEGDVMAPGQTLEALVDMLQRFLKERGLPEHIVEVQVEQSDACEGTQKCFPIESITEVKDKLYNNLRAREQLNQKMRDPSISLLSQMCNAVITCPARVSSAVSWICRPKPIFHDA